MNKSNKPLKHLIGSVGTSHEIQKTKELNIKIILKMISSSKI